MKVWVKAALLAIGTFIVLSLVAMLIAHQILKTNTLSPSHVARGKEANARLEEMLDKQIQAQNILAAETTYSLDDRDQKEELRQEGIILSFGENAHFKAAENKATGYNWLIDRTSCSDIVDIKSEFVAPQQKHRDPCFDSNNNQIICPDFRPTLGLPGTRLITLTAKARGSCVLRMAYERMFELNFDQWNGIPTTVPITVE